MKLKTLHEDRQILSQMVAEYLLENGIRSERVEFAGQADQLIVPPAGAPGKINMGPQVRIWAFDNGLIDAVYYSDLSTITPFKVHLDAHDPDSLEKLKDFIFKFEDVWVPART
jgi:hypothetical protein